MKQGLYIFIWQLNQCDGGDLAAIARRCLAAGVAGVIVKGSDGGRWFNQGMPLSEIVSGLQATGLGCGVWDYLYLSDPGASYYGYQVSGWQAEAQRVADTFAACTPDVYLLDVEGEAEAQDDPAGRALAFLDTLQGSLLNGQLARLAYCPLPIIDLHTRLPYYQFSNGPVPMPMWPQTYWTALGMSEAATAERVSADLAQYGLDTQPIVPVYADYDGARPAAADVSDFAAYAVAAGWTSIGLWSYQHMNADAWQRAATVIAALGAVAPPKPVPNPCGDLQAQLDQAKGALTQIHTLSGGFDVQRKAGGRRGSGFGTGANAAGGRSARSRDAG